MAQQEKKYTGVYTKETAKDTTYYITYRVDGKLYNKKAGTKKNGCSAKKASDIRAEEILKLKKQPTEIEQLVNVEADTVTLDYVYKHYINEKNRTSPLKPRSLASKNSIFKKFSKFHNKDISTISKDDILDCIKADNKERKKSNKTINEAISFMASMFNYANRQDLATCVNQAEKLDKLPIDNQRQRVLSVDEIKLLLKTVSDDPQLTLYVNLALNTGIRLSEAVSLKKEHINYTRNQIHITNHKKSRNYILPIPNKIKEMLKYRTDRIRRGTRILDFYGNKDLTKQIQRKLRPIMDNLFNIESYKEPVVDAKDDIEKHKLLKIEYAKIKEILKNKKKHHKDYVIYTTDTKERAVLHSYRHTYANMLLHNKGHNLYKVMTLLNHSSIKSTERYTKPQTNDDDLDDLF